MKKIFLLFVIFSNLGYSTIMAQRLSVFLSGGLQANLNRSRSIPEGIRTNQYLLPPAFGPELGLRIRYALEPNIHLRSGLLFTQRRITFVTHEMDSTRQVLENNPNRIFAWSGGRRFRVYSKTWLHIPLQLTFTKGHFFAGLGSGMMFQITSIEKGATNFWDIPLEASVGFEFKRMSFQLSYLRGTQGTYPPFIESGEETLSWINYYNSQLGLSISTRINNPGNKCAGCKNTWM
jgi:hypothetical protein